MKKKVQSESKSVRSPRADELVKTYRELGFVQNDDPHGVQLSGNGAWLAPVSFLPHIDYTVSSVVGGL